METTSLDVGLPVYRVRMHVRYTCPIVCTQSLRGVRSSLCHKIDQQVSLRCAYSAFKLPLHHYL
jgi:hypothetical protein